MKSPEAENRRTKGSGVRAIAWILLIAFTLQSFVTATHLHGVFDSGAARAAGLANASAHRNAPTDSGKAECPFCQAIVHAGAFCAPPAQTLVLPLSWAAVAVAFFAAETFLSVSSHRWQSRAPPQS